MSRRTYILVPTKLDLEAIAASLVDNLKEADLLSFLKTLDDCVEDFDFTADCAKFYVKMLSEDDEMWELFSKFYDELKVKRLSLNAKE